MSRVENSTNYGPLGEQAMNRMFTDAIRETTGDANATYLGEPVNFLYCPVFDSFQEPIKYQPQIPAKQLVGMLSTLGVTLAADAFGPIADNAGKFCFSLETEYG